jgi:endoglucanase
VWLSGGSASCSTSNGSATYQVAGMQQLYNAVRATGAQNLVIAGGLQFAFDLSGVPSNRIQGTNIMYNTHPYNEFQKTTPAEWFTAFGFLAATDPVIATEFGDTSSSTCATSTYDSSILPYFDAMGAAGTTPANRISWTAWAFYPGGCSFPSLLTDWSYDTTAPGAVVEASLKAFHQ